MKPKQLFILIGSLLGCAIVLGLIYAFSPLNQKMYRASFSRNFADGPVFEQEGVLDIEFNSFYFAGVANDHLYLGNRTAPFHLLITNTMLTDTQHVLLNIKEKQGITDYRKFKLHVDSPYFFLTEGTLPGVFRGDFKTWVASRFLPDDSAYFVEAMPTSATSFALRCYSTDSKAYELAREAADTPYFEIKHGLLEKQVDGLFCVDGTLHYNKQLKQLVYLYHYRNQYITMDADLNLLHRYNTIDTFSRALVKVAHIESKNYSTLATPPMQINGYSATAGDKLYLQSNLLAQNEDEERFKMESIIDVYDITKGQYIESFYLPHYQDHKLLGFYVFGDHLAALYDRYLVMYRRNE